MLFTTKVGTAPTGVNNTSCPIHTIMSTKRWRKQLKFAQDASLKVFKKKRLEANRAPHPALLGVYLLNVMLVSILFFSSINF